MATLSGRNASFAVLTQEMEDALASIGKMEKKGQLSKAKANKARRAVQKEYDDNLNAVIGKKKSAGGGALSDPTGEGGQEASSESKRDWPVHDSVKTLVAQSYVSFAEGKKAIAAAFVANSLYHGIGNHREAATERSKKKGGAGGGAGRGYLDWEFKDGTLGCR